jgi:enoyl-CoA hydratase/carnithine racemase
MEFSEYSSLNLRFANDGQLLLLELKHGKANEMGLEQLNDFARLCDDLEANTDVRSVITYSTKRSKRGTPIFIAGANVSERVGWDDSRVKAHVAWQREVMNRLRHVPVFTLAVVDGVALGWGTEYMLVCDYRICTDAASFALPETGLGILPGAGGTSEMWAHIGVAQTLRLGMLGERVGGREAASLGLVQECLADGEQAMARAHELAALAAQRSPTALAQFKRGVLASVGSSPVQRVAIETRAYDRCVDHGDAAIGREYFALIRKDEPVPWPPRESSID